MVDINSACALSTIYRAYVFKQILLFLQAVTSSTITIHRYVEQYDQPHNGTLLSCMYISGINMYIIGV